MTAAAGGPTRTTQQRSTESAGVGSEPNTPAAPRAQGKTANAVLRAETYGTRELTFLRRAEVIRSRLALPLQNKKLQENEKEEKIEICESKNEPGVIARLAAIYLSLPLVLQQSLCTTTELNWHTAHTWHLVHFSQVMGECEELERYVFALQPDYQNEK